MLDRAFARDKAYDGRFLTGVLSTGIYCLPSCPARNPKAENVRFFSTEDGARRAGLRACRRCRPDFFYRHHDPDREQLTDLARRVEAEPTAFPTVDALTETSGIGVTKLNALFRCHYHTSPAAFLHRARVTAACHQLLETDRRILDVGFDVGYESSSAFHENFRKLTGMSPRRYRELRRGRDFTLGLPPDYRTEDILRVHGRDPDSPTERVEGRSLSRTVRLEGRPALLHLTFQRRQVQGRVEPTGRLGAAGMAQAHRSAWRLLGGGSEPDAFEQRARRQPPLRRLARRRKGLRIPQSPDVFEGLTWSILGQQVNLPHAFRLRQRLIALAGAPAGRGLHAHPTPAAVARLDYRDLTRRQFSRRKAEYLIDLARQVVAGEHVPEELPTRPASQVETRLLAVRGLGPWSTHYVMMRACGFADCVPVGDTGLSTALQRFFDLDRRPDPTETRTLMEAFAPFRSLATFHLWMTLGDPA